MFFFSICSYGQFVDRLSLELNLGRYAKTVGLFTEFDYSNDFTTISGVNINYSLSPKFDLFMGVRKFDVNIRGYGGEVYEETRSNGWEFRLGTKFSKGRHKRFFFSYGFELFGRFSKLTGIFDTDTPPFAYEVNHQVQYVGIAPSLGLNVRLLERIHFFADSRLTVGKRWFKARESSIHYRIIYPKRSSIMTVFEPLSAMGIRVQL